TITEKLLTYALGRGLAYTDAPTVRAIVRDAAREDFRWAALISEVVASDATRPPTTKILVEANIAMPLCRWLRMRASSMRMSRRNISCIQRWRCSFMIPRTDLCCSLSLSAIKVYPVQTPKNQSTEMMSSGVSNDSIYGVP
ncbi:MAG TPA: DUF1585 domain-containing protein, partial [Alphaproteobacteria bacterium]|nr:DUF1585 domain-containing protein [Alphaproteobacteria bacterium]